MPESSSAKPASARSFVIEVPRTILPKMNSNNTLEEELAIVILKLFIEENTICSVSGIGVQRLSFSSRWPSRDRNTFIYPQMRKSRRLMIMENGS